MTPDIQGALVVPSKRFWKGRKADWPVSGVVQHYTASTSEKGLVNWMASDGAKNSAHIFIYRNGTIVQMVRFADRAFHAGEKQAHGRWKGKPQPTNVNQFTIGIENCNAGWLMKGDDGKFYLPKKTQSGYVTGRPYKGPEPKQAKDHMGQMRWWEPYADKLLLANVQVLKRIIEMYPNIQPEDVGFHSDVSPHRKHDPGPLWPHEWVLGEAFGKPTGNLYPVAFEVDDPDDDDDEIADLDANRGDNAAGEENPEWHYDYDAQMSMIERVVDPE